MKYFYTVSYVIQDKDKFSSRVLGLYSNKEQAYRDACVLFCNRNDCDTDYQFFPNKPISMKPYIIEAQRDLHKRGADYEAIFNRLQKELYTVSLRGQLTPTYIPRHCWISVSRGLQEFPDQVVSMIDITVTKDAVEMDLKSRGLLKPY